MSAGDVDRAVTEALRVLAPWRDADWRVPAGSLDWTCRETAVHLARDLLAYAAQVAAGPTDAYLPLDLTVREEAPVAEVLRVVSACAALLVRALDAAGPDTRAWHWGPTDPSGFAALGVNETLMHTYDITQGLGVAWLPPAPLCAGVLDRLFPDPPAGDPVRVLLWCTGRAELPGRPRRTSWVVKAARG